MIARRLYLYSDLSACLFYIETKLKLMKEKLEVTV